MDYAVHGGGMFFGGQPHADAGGGAKHHRRAPSDPFEFDEPLVADDGLMFASMKSEHCIDNPFQELHDGDAAMTVVEDCHTSGSDSDDSHASMVEDMAELSQPAAASRTGGGFWGDDAWMLGMSTDDSTHDGSWLSSCGGPLDLVPVGRSTSYDSTMSAGVTPSALPFMSPCSNAADLLSPLDTSPAPAPAFEPACSSTATVVGEKRARFSAGASPQHRMGKINRPSTMLPGEPSAGAPSAPATSAGDCEPPPLLQKPLPAEVAARMLKDDSYDPGVRPLIFNAADGQWLFKERSRGRTPNMRAVNERANERADRWHNSGGVRGARDMPKKGTPLVRRRYGSVAQNGEILWRFHEYSALTVVDDPTAPNGQRVEEDRSTVVFHVMPKRSGKGRPSKAEADLPAQMWKEYGWAA